ncbi:oligoribonuclease [Silene latifolia]|uniref:oligoribonuclease n=1 Tax=Silene latifolia TaxID=37657 RepID=UPI003D783BF5
MVDYLSNAFSVLGLEDGDSPSSLASTSDAGTSNSNGKSSSDKLAAENGNNKDEKLSAPASEFRLPLVWIDLEMTGLNIEVDRIVEIACIITDGSLSKSVEGPDLVIHQSQECLDRMNEWCQNHHAASGLTKEVLESTVSESEAEKQVISFVKKHVGTTHRPLLAGNSIYVDFIFLKKYMPDLASIFSHVLVDVSTIKALCIRWYPRAHKKAPAKEQKHRAREDIRESIMELKYFRENIFIKPPKK